MEKVMNEQIKKKKEMLQENKELKSKLNMLNSRVNAASDQLTKLMSSYSQSEAVAENKDLTVQLNALKKMKERFDEEMGLLRRENAFLKQNLNALTASRGEEHTDYEMLTEEQLQQVKDQEIKEVQDLQQMISQCVEKILSSAKPTAQAPKQLPPTIEEIEKAFSDLKDHQNKLYTVTEKLQSYKAKVQKIENGFLVEKHQLIVANHRKETENKLLKLQIEELTQGDGKFV